MKPIDTFTVKPSLPEALEPLRAIAYNLRWAWDHDTIELFRRLDDDLWATSGHNPILMLGGVEQAKLEAADSDAGFLAHLDRVSRNLDEYMSTASTWFVRVHPDVESRPLVAYFSAEFGMTECLSIFAGGLGILAGDHLKSASDLGIPLVGVGLLYQKGYFRQYLNEAGWQQESYEANDFHNLPLTLVRQEHGAPLTIQVPRPGRQVTARLWRAQVGRVPLYLLDTNIPPNSQHDQDITDELYGGDSQMRIEQEIVLGIGGYRALEAQGLRPVVYHMNEGHSAFLALEHIRQLMVAEALSFPEAREAASASLVFTTHTPVAAGHDYFTPDLMRRYLDDYASGLGLSSREFVDLGREDPGNESAPFCMTTLALRLAAHSNAVSRLHGRITRHMWHMLWPGVPEDQVPIGHVTNGVHFRSWISKEMNQLYDRYLGPRWREEPGDKTVWARAEHIASEELWRTHERRRERLVSFARRRLYEQLVQRGAPQAEIEASYEVLDPKALTIGFARRFATYKRATLLLRDPQRLAKILDAPDRPVQIIYAGKAHPQDNAGKELIAQIVKLAQQGPPFRRRLVFLEDYDMTIARYLVQGADVWLNTPRRPREASGTSGMKAAANGVLNLSVLDGWWDEAYEPGVGWALGRGETYDDPEYQDQVESEALYNLLERDVVPTFYDQGPDGLPRRWITLMKSSIGTLCHFFNTHRMVQQYTECFYLPAATRAQQLSAEGMQRARALAAWKARVLQNWARIQIRSVHAAWDDEVQVGDQLSIQVAVQLGELAPEDVVVEVYMGRVDVDGEIVDAEATALASSGTDGEGNHLFEANAIPCQKSGLHGYTVRVLPHHPDLVTPFLPGLIVWAEPGAIAG
ncbi:MAG: alpha-glucan family phosphorylase [Anaerolineae bacterium]